MEDTTAKTIDYLRARLLAERSVSRTARQRAYDLAKRVTELEKQLKFISLQRKKAEKATVDVLAILENHGRNEDCSEQFDSSSDEEEVSSDYKDSKHVEVSGKVKGKVRESDTEGFSGSEVESSSINGRSLSWKSSKNSSSRYLEKKYMEASRRRRNSFTSTGSSPIRVGKSCRQIRHRESRSADGSQNDETTNSRHEDEGVANVAPMTLFEEANIHEGKNSSEVVTYNGNIKQNHGSEREMERALEHQAEFIARYEAEEKAQREWEDKFRENNGSPLDSCDPGTHSDVTEERDEIKAPALVTPPPPPPPPPPFLNDKYTPGRQETDGVVDTNYGEEPKINTEPLLDQRNSDINDNKELDNKTRVLDLQVSSSQDNTLLYGEQTSGKSYEPTTHEDPDKLGSILEALQQAKLSLKQNLEKFPLLENGPSIPTYRSGEKYPVPFSSAAGLFRLPTDYEYGVTTAATTNRANALTFDSRLSLTNYPTEPSSGQFISSPYRGPLSRSAVSLDNRFNIVPTFPYQETRREITRLPPSSFDPRFDIPPSPLDPRLDMGVRPSAHDPRLGMSASSLDPRLGVGSSALDPRFGVGPSALDPRLGVGPSALDPRLGVGPSGFDPRFEMGSPFVGDRYTRIADRPLRTRSLYDDYSRPNM